MFITFIYYILYVPIIPILSLLHNDSCIINYNGTDKRIINLYKKSDISVLIHVHIPKAAGTALSLAMSSACKCRTNKIEKDDGSSKPDDHRQIDCMNCKVVRSKDRKFAYYYTLSRITGWKFKAHSPLAYMKYFLSDAKQKLNFVKKGLYPVYVVMLRNPFDRFLSECIHWVGNKEQAVDWSMKIINKDGKVDYLPGIQRQGNSMKDYLRAYAELPADFMIHNRQTKMIGGHVYDFHMDFNPEDTIGSRWQRVLPTRIGKSKNNIPIDRAKKVLRRYDDVILGLQERFAETICILEILYGHLYPFHWQPHIHTHNKDNKNFSISTLSNISSTTTNEYYQNRNIQEYPDIYEIWLKKNKADIELYKYAMKVFDKQFQSALCLLKTTTTISRKRKAQIPHCLPFL